MPQSTTDKPIVLTGQHGLKVTLTKLGARILSIQYQNKEMLLRYKTMHATSTDQYYLGTTCGRVANRIANAQYTHQGKTVLLDANEGCNILHGGLKNFSNQVWQVYNQNNQDSVEFTLQSADGDQGFPGELIAHVRYQLIDAKLQISLSAHTNKVTPIDLTNHCYFNLAESDCLDLNLQINTSSYLLKDNKNVPTGEIRNLNKQMLFNHQPISKSLNCWQQYEQIGKQGFDHYMIFNRTDADIPQATISSEQNAIKMQLYTNQPGIQLYTGGHLGTPFKPFSGVCLEAQNYPNAVNIAHFPSPMVGPGEVYQSQITFAFSQL